jgi:hypothetical protein
MSLHAPAPLSFGGVVLVTTGSLVGWEAADLIHRKIVCIAPGGQLPAGFEGTVDQYNALAVVAKPSWASVGFQTGLSVLGFLTGALVPWNWAKCLLLGVGVGSTAHVGCQLLNFYVVQPLFVNTTAKDSTLFQDAYVANTQLGYTTTATTTTTTSSSSSGTSSGLPRSSRGTPVVAGGVGAAVRALPASRPVRIPAALATGRVGEPPGCGCPDKASTVGAPPAASKIPEPPKLPEVTPSTLAGSAHPLFLELMKADSRVAA